MLTNSGFVKHYNEYGTSVSGIPPYSYQHVANFTRMKPARRAKSSVSLNAGLEASKDGAIDDSEDASSGAGNQGVAGENSAQPQTYRSLIQSHIADSAWDIIKRYRDAKDHMQQDLEHDQRALLQKEAMRTVEQNAIYKTGVHEHSNYLFGQTEPVLAHQLSR